MLGRKRVLAGAIAVGAGVLAAVKARRKGTPSLPPAVEPPPPAAEPAEKPVAAVEPAEPPPAAPPKPPADAEPTATAKPKPAPKPKSASKPKGAAKPVKSLTREELYREAKRLGIEGRSKMSKGELERAVAKASAN